MYKDPLQHVASFVPEGLGGSDHDETEASRATISWAMSPIICDVFRLSSDGVPPEVEGAGEALFPERLAQRPLFIGLDADFRPATRPGPGVLPYGPSSLERWVESAPRDAAELARIEEYRRDVAGSVSFLEHLRNGAELLNWLPEWVRRQSDDRLHWSGELQEDLVVAAETTRRRDLGLAHHPCRGIQCDYEHEYPAWGRRGSLWALLTGWAGAMAARETRAFRLLRQPADPAAVALHAAEQRERLLAELRRDLAEARNERERRAAQEELELGSRRGALL